MPNSLNFSLDTLYIKLVQSELYQDQKENKSLTFGEMTFQRDPDQQNALSGIMSLKPHIDTPVTLWLDAVDTVEHGRFIYTVPTRNRSFSLPIVGKHPPSWIAVARAQANRETEDFLILHIPLTETQSDWQSTPQIMAESQSAANIHNFTSDEDAEDVIPLQMGLTKYHIIFLNIAPKAASVFRAFDTPEQQTEIAAFLS